MTAEGGSRVRVYVRISLCIVSTTFKKVGKERWGTYIGLFSRQSQSLEYSTKQPASHASSLSPLTLFMLCVVCSCSSIFTYSCVCVHLLMSAHTHSIVCRLRIRIQLYLLIVTSIATLLNNTLCFRV